MIIIPFPSFAQYNGETEIKSNQFTISEFPMIDGYTITYITNEGVWEADYEIPVEYTRGTVLELPDKNNIQREGYSFRGWYTSEDYSGQPVSRMIPEDPWYRQIGKNIILYAKWDTPRKITYVTNGGTWVSGYISPNEYFSGDYLHLPDRYNIEKAGYHFLGWYNNENFLGNDIREIFPGSSATDGQGDIILYAKWDIPYTVTYVVNGGEWIPGYIAPTEFLPIDGENQWLPNDHQIKKEGYILKGWNTEADFSGVCVTGFSEYASWYEEYPDKQITLYAEWVEPYTITYVMNGGTWATYEYEHGGQIYTEEYTPVTVFCAGTEVSVPYCDNIVNEGYGFAGWYREPDFSGEEVRYIGSWESWYEEYEDKNIILYARWETPYTISYVLNGGTWTSYIDQNRPDYKIPTEFGWGNGVQLPDANYVEKPGYTLQGWYTDVDCIGDNVTYITGKETWIETCTDKHIVLYAKWVEAYTITYVTNGGNWKTNIYEQVPTTYVPGTYLYLPTYLEKAGQWFVGWYKSEDLTETPIHMLDPYDTWYEELEGKHIVLYAKWVPANIVLYEGKRFNETIKQLASGQYDSWYPSNSWNGDYTTSDAKIKNIIIMQNPSYDELMGTGIPTDSRYWASIGGPPGDGNGYAQAAYSSYTGNIIIWTSDSSTLWLNYDSSYMFSGLSELVSVQTEQSLPVWGNDAGRSDTIDCAYMFSGCSKLQKVNIGYDQDDIYGIALIDFFSDIVPTGMFYGCEELEAVNMAGRKFNEDYRSYPYEGYCNMFNGCHSLSLINGRNSYFRIEIPDFFENMLKDAATLSKSCTVLENEYGNMERIFKTEGTGIVEEYFVFISEDATLTLDANGGMFEDGSTIMSFESAGEEINEDG